MQDTNIFYGRKCIILICPFTYNRNVGCMSYHGAMNSLVSCDDSMLLYRIVAVALTSRTPRG